jgi:hypothetical protein
MGTSMNRAPCLVEREKGRRCGEWARIGCIGCVVDEVRCTTSVCVWVLFSSPRLLDPVHIEGEGKDDARTGLCDARAPLPAPPAPFSHIDWAFETLGDGRSWAHGGRGTAAGRRCCCAV